MLVQLRDDSAVESDHGSGPFGGKASSWVSKRRRTALSFLI